MLSKFFFFIIRTIVFLVFLGWLASKVLIGDISSAPAHDFYHRANSSGGLIVPNNDPRFSNGN